MSKVSELLHSMFSENAIKKAAICEQIEDIRYCTRHGMNHMHGGKEKARWEAAVARGKRLGKNDTTFTMRNIRRFQAAVNNLVRKNPKMKVFAGLSKTEYYAVRYIYYYDSRN